jgi:hypothetical protein
MTAAAALVVATAGVSLVVGSDPSRAATSRVTGTRLVLLLGDSLTSETARVFEPPPGWQLAFIARPGMAPCDWLADAPPNFYSAMAVHPAVVIIETAGNDSTGCMRVHGSFPAVGTPAYLSRYEAALDTIFTASRRDGARVILLAPPPLLEPHLGAALATVVDWASHDEHVATSFGPRRSVSLNDGFALELRCLPGETAQQGCVDGEIPVRTLDDYYHLHFCPHVRDFTFFFTCAVYSSGETRWARATMSLLG